MIILIYYHLFRHMTPPMLNAELYLSICTIEKVILIIMAVWMMSFPQTNHQSSGYIRMTFFIWQISWHVGNYGWHMADIQLTYGCSTADRRLTYGRYTADMWLIYGRYTANIWPTYGWHTPDMRPKTDSKFFIMNWLCGRYIQLICGWHTPNIWLMYGQKLILRLWLYGYHSCFLYGDQDFSYRPYIWRMSAVCQQYVRLMLALYPPYICRMSAFCQPYICRMSAVCQPYNRRMSAIPKLPICQFS